MAKNKDRRSHPAAGVARAAALGVGKRRLRGARGVAAAVPAGRGLGVPASPWGVGQTPPGASLVTRLRWVASHMRCIGLDMVRVSAFGPWEVHGQQLLGAAKIAEAWAAAMEGGRA